MGLKPIFFSLDKVLLAKTVVDSVAGLGYEVVEARQLGNGILQVFIDFPWHPGAPSPAITVDDCERVSRHLVYVLPVEGIDYQRLEVSSPGLERPLHKLSDYQRFAGDEVALTFKAPPPGWDRQRRFQGVLEVAGETLQLRLAAPQNNEATTTLPFTLDMVEKAQLSPADVFPRRSLPPGRSHDRRSKGQRGSARAG